MADYRKDPWYEPSEWNAPISEQESRVKPFTGMQPMKVPDAPPAASSPEGGYSVNPPAQQNYTTGYTPSIYSGGQAAGAPGAVSEYGAGMDTWRYGSPGDIRRAKYAASSGGYSRGSANNGANRSVSRTTFTQPRPTAPKMPTLKLPKVNKRKIAALQQKHSAGGIRRLREALQQATAGGSDNPNVRRMTIREALQGYGTGLEGVMAGAYGTARSEHMADVQQQSQEAQLNWQAEVTRQNQVYQQAINEYMASAAKSTTSGPATEVSEPAPQPTYLRSAYTTLQPYGMQGG